MGRCSPNPPIYLYVQVWTTTPNSASERANKLQSTDKHPNSRAVRGHDGALTEGL